MPDSASDVEVPLDRFAKFSSGFPSPVSRGATKAMTVWPGFWVSAIPGDAKNYQNSEENISLNCWQFVDFWGIC